MSHAVIDTPEIIQVKYENSGRFCDRLRYTQQFFTFILVGQTSCFIQIYFALQDPVHGSITQCFKKFISKQQHQHHNIRSNKLLNSFQRGSFLLRIFFRQSGSFITNLKEMLTFINDLRILITFFPYKHNLLLQVLKIVIQFFHLILEAFIIQTDEIQLITPISQAIYKRLYILDHSILRLSCILHLYHTLRFAAHKSCIIHDSGSSLDSGNK